MPYKNFSALSVGAVTPMVVARRGNLFSGYELKILPRACILIFFLILAIGYDTICTVKEKKIFGRFSPQFFSGIGELCVSPILIPRFAAFFSAEKFCKTLSTVLIIA